MSGILFSIVITGVVGVLMTFVAIGTVDRWGRSGIDADRRTGTNRNLYCNRVGLSSKHEGVGSGSSGGWGDSVLLLLAGANHVGHLV